MRLRAYLRRMLMPEATGPQLVAAAPRVPVRTIFRRFWPDARPYRRWIAVGLVFAVIVPAIETAEIWLFKLVVDEVLVPGDLGPLGWIALAYVSLTLIGALINFGDSYLAAWVGERFVLNLRTRVFAHIQRLSAGDVDKRRVGDLVSRMSGDVAAIETVALAGIADFLSAFFRILFFGGALLYLEWSLATVALVIAPLFWLTARSFSRLIEERRAREAPPQRLAERRRPRRASRTPPWSRPTTARTPRSRASAARARASWRPSSPRPASRRSSPPSSTCSSSAAALLVIGLGTWAVAEGRLTIGGLLVFLAYLTQLLGPVRDLSSLANSIFAAAAGAERVIELLDEEPRVADRRGRDGAHRAPAAWSRSTTSRSPTPAPTRPPCGTCPCGSSPARPSRSSAPSGAGKSTLARMILRLHDPDTGRVRLDGHDVRDVTLASLPRLDGRADAGDPGAAGIGAGEHRRRPARRDRRRDRRGRACGRGRRLPPRPARRVRHHARRPRAQPVGRPAPAGRDRPGPRARRAAPDPRRAVHRARRAHRAAASSSRCAS